MIGEFSVWILWVFHPIYLSEVVHASVQQTGFFTAIPWAFYILAALTSGYISDKIIVNGILSATTTRKLFCAICMQEYRPWSK